MSAIAEQVSDSRWVVFRLAGESFAIDVMQVREILPMSPVVPVPGAAEAVLGVIQWRDSIVTVVSVNARLGLPRAELASRIIITEHGPTIIGLAVDDVVEVVDIPSAAMQAPPCLGALTGPPFLRALHHRRGETLQLLDLNLLLAAPADTPSSFMRET